MGILIGCRNTIISTAVVEIILVFIIFGSNLLSVPGLTYLFGAAVALFVLQIFYTFLIKKDTTKQERFVWAAYHQRDQQGDKRERLVIGENV